MLLDAVEILLENESPAFCLWIIGGSPREVELVADLIRNSDALSKLASSGRLIIWGRIENEALAEFYSRALVTVVPSIQEEFGIVAVEAMMSGCPVIASRVGGLANIVDSARAVGILVEAGNPEALADAIGMYLGNKLLRNDQGENARRLALERYSMEKAFSAIAESYFN